MTIPFAGSPGDLFDCCGKLGALIANLRSFQATQLTAMTNTTTGVVAQYNTESDIQALMGSSYIGLLNGGATSFGTTAQQIAQATFNRMVFRDNPQLNQTLTQIQIPLSIQQVIAQMKTTGTTILAMTITGTPGAFVGIGNGVVNISVKRPLDGLVLENSYGENITITCNNDSYTGSAQPGNEGFSLTGEGNESNLFAFDWPLGSNCSTSITAINGSSDNSQGNILTNSGFSAWTTGVLNNFTTTVGGGTITQSTGVTYDTNDCLLLTGDGVTLTSFNQAFNSSTGTSGTVDPITQYSFNIFLRRGGSAITNGTLIVELIDNSGAVIPDQNGVNNQITISLTGLTTVFTAYNGEFRTPEALASSVFIRYRLSAAVNAAGQVYMARSSLGIMTQAYISGPFFACHSGSVPFNAGDYSLSTIANSRGAAGTLNTFQTLLALLLDPYVYQNEYLFPSSASPSISDSLIS